MNYIIATYNGSVNRKHSHPHPEDVLKCHIEQLNSVKHNLKKITMMKAKCENPAYKNYYNYSKKNIKEIDVENYGYSMGQWLKCYEFDRSYDWYLFNEDDYCPNIDNFDTILKEIYMKKFPDKIGLLCSVVEGSKDYEDGSFPIHFEGIVLLSRETLEELYGKLKDKPRMLLDKLDSRLAKCFDKIKKKYLGGYYQLTFSFLFTSVGIEHKDYINEYKHFYWDDNRNEVTKYLKNGKKTKRFKLSEIKESIFIPVQLQNEDFIKHHITL